MVAAHLQYNPQSIDLDINASKNMPKLHWLQLLNVVFQLIQYSPFWFCSVSDKKNILKILQRLFLNKCADKSLLNIIFSCLQFILDFKDSNYPYSRDSRSIYPVSHSLGLMEIAFLLKLC